MQRHPPGLYVLCATEMWERFAFYGLRALLVLYLLQVVLPQGAHAAAAIVGLGALRHAFALFGGPQDDGAFASRLYGLYSALVYLLPLVGGFAADRWLGRTRAVMAGAVVMAASLLAMTFPALCLLALSGLVVGTGLLKGNIAAQIGTLYPRGSSLLARGFSLFYLGINGGAVLGPLVCGALALHFGWRPAFLAAALGMVLATVIYGIGRPLLRRGPGLDSQLDPTPRAAHGPANPALPGMVLLASILFWTTYEQQGNAMVRWRAGAGEGAGFAGVWLQSVPPAVVILGTPLIALLWRSRERAHGEASWMRMVVGLGIVVAAQILLVFVAIHGGAPPVGTLLFYLVAWEIGDLNFSPAAMAYIAHRAPPGREGFAMALWYLSIFAGDLFAGFYGAWWERLSPPVFWGIVALLPVLGLPLLLRRGGADRDAGPGSPPKGHGGEALAGRGK